MALHEHDGARRAELFICVADEDDVACQGSARPFECDHGHQLSDAVALHVDCAAAPDVTVLDHSRKRLNRPRCRIHRHYIDVMHERDRLLAAVTAQARVEVRAVRSELGRVQYLRFDPFAIENRLQEPGAENFVARRVGGVDAQVVGKNAL